MGEIFRLEQSRIDCGTNISVGPLVEGRGS